MFADPLIQMLLAMWAAQDGRPDALTRGDAAAKALLDTGAWSLIDYSVYIAKPPAERLAFWAKGGPLPDYRYLPSMLSITKSIYDSYYGGFLPFGQAYKSYAGLMATGEAIAEGAAAAANAAAEGLAMLVKGAVVIVVGLGAIYVVANRSSR